MSFITMLIRRHQRAALSTVLLTLFLTFWITRCREFAKDHHLSQDLIHHTSTFEAGQQTILSPSEAKSICSANGFSVYHKNSKSPARKVYDLVLLSTELDWLEIRLHTLTPYVDYFVIVEAPTTFTGKSKPLYLKENWEKFAPFHSKIIHRVVHDPVASDRIWDHEGWFRNSMLDEVFPGLQGTSAEAQYGDALVISDMDEIIRPGVALLLRYCDFPSRLILRTEFYYYSFQWRHQGPQWPHPDATVYKGANTLPPNHLRAGLLDSSWLFQPYAAFRRWWDRGTLWNAGWHCSSCFATVAEMRTKMRSFSHQGWNTGYNRDAQVIIERVRDGKDLFGRISEVYTRVEDNQDVPAYVLKEYKSRGRFKYLLNRDGDDTGFEDWETIGRSDD